MYLTFGKINVDDSEDKDWFLLPRLIELYKNEKFNIFKRRLKFWISFSKKFVYIRQKWLKEIWKILKKI